MKSRFLLLLALALFSGIATHATDKNCPEFSDADITVFRDVLEHATLIRGRQIEATEDKRLLRYGERSFFMPSLQRDYLVQEGVGKMGKAQIERITFEREESMVNRVQCHYIAQMRSLYAPDSPMTDFRFRMTYLIKMK